MAIDVEAELEKIYESLAGTEADAVDRRLKILELLAKMRSTGRKVNPNDPIRDRRGEVSAMLDQINGTKTAPKA